VDKTSESLRAIFLSINPSDIVVFNFIVESYEGVAEVRTLCPEKGHLVMLAVEDTATSARELVESLKAEIDIREIPAPEVVHGDWLLGEWAKETLAVD